MANQFFPVDVRDRVALSGYLSSRLRTEEFRLAEYIHHLIEMSVPVLGSATRGDLNKLLVLRAAREIGFLTPKTFVTNHAEGLQRVTAQAPDLITKAISEAVYLFDKSESETGYFWYTEQVTEKLLASGPDRISPSLLQEHIRKAFELRVFYLIDECHSMAILSQTDPQTQVDFRKYNDRKPNRMIPFRLPEEIDHKIKRLFSILNLNTGSVDLIVDTDGNFYFLEINPVGLFSMVSAPCNYLLEKKIAVRLMEYAQRD